MKGEWELFNNSADSPNTYHESTTGHGSLVEKEDLAHIFSNLFHIALTGLLIPTSIADCERGFSALK